MSNSYIGGLGPPSQNSAGVLDLAYDTDRIELNGSRQRTLGHFDHGRIYVPATKMSIDHNNSSFGGIGSGYASLHSTVLSRLGVNLDLSSWSTGSMRITAYYTLSSASTGIVRWLTWNDYYSSTSSGETLSTIASANHEQLGLNQQASSSGATGANVLRTAVIRSTSNGSYDGNVDIELGVMRVFRNGADAVDTYGGVVRLHGVLFELVTT